MEQTTASKKDLEAPIEAPTVCEAFQRLVAREPDGTALRTLDDSVSLTWSELGERVEALAGGLAGLGIGKGDTVAMLLPNVPECHIIDFAAVHLGAIPFTIYNSSSPEQIAHQMDNADARVIFTQKDFLPKVEEAKKELPGLEHVIVVDGEEGDGTLSMADFEAGAPDDFDFEAAWRAVEAEDRVTLIYTSGTTGPPKGAEYAHRTVMAQLRALDAAVPLPSEDVISFLPMAHAGGRLTSHYMSLPYGATITACPDITQLPAYMAGVRPDSLFAPPRLWEKLQGGIGAMVEGQPDEEQKAALKQAIEDGLALVRAEEAGDEVTDEMVAAHERGVEMLKPILAKVGLDRIKASFVGGAPSAPELSQFFRAVGCPMLEAYGLTEGSLNVFNRIDEFKGGTAGTPLPGVELKLAEDGEILLRGDLNFVGYRKQPQQTAEALDADGWLHTGDIGELDEDGYLTVIDRKKEIIISASGKNMSPAVIESAIKGESSPIGQVVTVGDGRRYNTALLTLDPEAAPVWAKRLGIESESVAELAEDPKMLKAVEDAIEAGNQRLSRVEQIKKFKLLPDVWMPDSDELTPTLKLKRKPIAAKYSAEIEELYAE